MIRKNGVDSGQKCINNKDIYVATASVAQKKKMRPLKEWIISAHPKYYDIQSAFESADEIVWKQGTGIETGDTVYM